MPFAWLKTSNLLFSENLYFLERMILLDKIFCAPGQKSSRRKLILWLFGLWDLVFEYAVLIKNLEI